MYNMSKKNIGYFLGSIVKKFKTNLFFMMISVLSLLIITGCTNKNSTIGFPGESIENYSVEFPSTIFEEIYTYREDIQPYPQNRKLLLGNYQGTDARILIRFVTTASDTTFVDLIEDDPEITLIINDHTQNLQPFNVMIAPLKNNLFQQNFATWEKFDHDDADYWDNVGGDFGEPVSIGLTSFFIAEPDTFRFKIDKNIVKNWIQDQNYGLIIYSDDAKDSFIEFHSSEAAQSGQRPEINITFRDETDPIVRQANSDTFIHDKKDVPFSSDMLYFANIAPRSVYAKLDLSYETHKEIWQEHGIHSETDLRRINIIQAQIIFTVNEENTMNTNTYLTESTYFDFDVSVGALKIEMTDYQEPFDYGESVVWQDFQSNRGVISDEGKLKIDVSASFRQIIPQNRENHGLVIRNNQRNMDFSYINVFNKEEGDDFQKPRLSLKYSVLK